MRKGHPDPDSVVSITRCIQQVLNNAASCTVTARRGQAIRRPSMDSLMYSEPLDQVALEVMTPFYSWRNWGLAA